MLSAARVEAIALRKKEQQVHLRLKRPRQGAVEQVHLSWAWSDRCAPVVWSSRPVWRAGFRKDASSLTPPPGPPHLAHICLSAGLPFVAADHPLRFSRVSPVRGGVLSYEHKHTRVLKYAQSPPQPGGRVREQAFHILLIACRATCPRGAGQSPVLPLTGLRLRSTHLCIPRGKEKGPRE